MPPISSVVIDRFKRLPRRSDEVWQGRLVRARVWVEEPDGLIEQFGDEPTALWRYGRALSAFRREGDSRAARECLRAALRTNRHVP